MIEIVLYKTNDNVIKYEIGLDAVCWYTMFIAVAKVTRLPWIAVSRKINHEITNYVRNQRRLNKYEY